MSLVTTAMECFGASARHSAAVSVVLPAPTGPPMPTRRGPLGDVARGVMSASSSRSENAGIQRLVPLAGDVQRGREATDIVGLGAHRSGGQRGTKRLQRMGDPLPVGLA